MTFKDEKQWFDQAEYDIHAAEKVFDIGLYPYTIFMCHLSVEKALKAMYCHKLKDEPPKMHDLSKLVALLNLDVPKNIAAYIDDLASVSVESRYPEDIKQVLKFYDKKKTEPILRNSKKVVEWLKTQLTRT